MRRKGGGVFDAPLMLTEGDTKSASALGRLIERRRCFTLCGRLPEPGTDLFSSFIQCRFSINIYLEHRSSSCILIKAKVVLLKLSATN